MAMVSRMVWVALIGIVVSGCSGFEFRVNPYKSRFDYMGLCEYYRSIGVSSVECGITPGEAISTRPYR